MEQKQILFFINLNIKTVPQNSLLDTVVKHYSSLRNSLQFMIRTQKFTKNPKNNFEYHSRSIKSRLKNLSETFNTGRLKCAGTVLSDQTYILNFFNFYQSTFVAIEPGLKAGSR